MLAILIHVNTRTHTHRRKVSLSMFKSRLYVAFREFYVDNKDGQEKPGQVRVRGVGG